MFCLCLKSITFYLDSMLRNWQYKLMKAWTVFRGAGERGRATMRTEGTERERKRQRESVCVCARLRVSVLGCYAAISKPFVYLVKDKIFKMTWNCYLKLPKWLWFHEWLIYKVKVKYIPILICCRFYIMVECIKSKDYFFWL